MVSFKELLCLLAIKLDNLIILSGALIVIARTVVLLKKIYEFECYKSQIHICFTLNCILIISVLAKICYELAKKQTCKWVVYVFVLAVYVGAIFFLVFSLGQAFTADRDFLVCSRDYFTNKLRYNSANETIRDSYQTVNKNNLNPKHRMTTHDACFILISFFFRKINAVAGTVRMTISIKI